MKNRSYNMALFARAASSENRPLSGTKPRRQYLRCAKERAVNLGLVSRMRCSALLAVHR